MTERDTVLLVAVGRLGRSVIEAGRRLGIELPGHVLLAPGEPVPHGLRAPGGAIVVLDAAVDGGDFWDSVAAAACGGPAIAVAVGGGGARQCQDVAWIALERAPGVEEAAALLVAGLCSGGGFRVPDTAAARFAKVDLGPGKPREACARRLAGRCAERLLMDLPAAVDPARHLVGLSPSWAVLRGADLPSDDAGEGYQALGDAMADPVAPVAAAFAAGTLRVRDVAGAARAAVAGLAERHAVVPLTVLAGDLDRAMAGIVATGGLGAGRALLTAMLSATVARRDTRETGPLDPNAQLDLDKMPDQDALPGLEDDHGDASLEDVLADLDRRARSFALAITFTKRAALLSGLRDLADAARRCAARRAVLPATEPIMALLEGRWARLDAVEDSLAVFAAQPASGQAFPVRDEDYLVALPGGEEAAIDSLLREPAFGPSLLSGDLAGFLTARAATRFFAWVPEQAETSPLDPAGLGPGTDARPLVAAISGVPGSLPAGQAIDLARKLAAGSPVEPVAVPIESPGAAYVVHIVATQDAATVRAPRDLSQDGAPSQPIRGVAPGSGREGASSGPAHAGRGIDPHEPPLAGDDGFWAAFRGLIARARPTYDDPALALEASRGKAPLLRLDAFWLERRDALRAQDDGCPARARIASRRPTDEPGASLDAALEHAHLWEDGLSFWEFRRQAAADSEAPHSWRTRAPLAASRPLDDDHPAWYGAAAAGPHDPLADTAELVAIGLATHLISHVEGYLAYTYAEDNGLIHTAILAPADDPAGTIAGLLANPEALPLLRRDAGARLADSRFHDAIRAYAHDLGAEVATRDWLRMPVNPHQRLLADRGLALMDHLPERAGRGQDGAVEAPSQDVAWDAGMVLPGLAAGGAA